MIFDAGGVAVARRIVGEIVVARAQVGIVAGSRENLILENSATSITAWEINHIDSRYVGLVGPTQWGFAGREKPDALRMLR
jgi:hypothetical protein